jgi:pimeloyl-ACP methyl ester carboxylesterase
LLAISGHPDRCHSLTLYGSFAKFSSWIGTDEEFDGLIDYIDNQWGSGASMPLFAPSRQDDAALQTWWGRFERLAASPSAAIELMRMNREIDLTDILPSIRVPTLIVHRKDDTLIDVEGGQLLAERIPGARYEEFPGIDHIPMVGENASQILNPDSCRRGSNVAIRWDGVRSTPSFHRYISKVLPAKSDPLRKSPNSAQQSLSA